MKPILALLAACAFAPSAQAQRLYAVQPLNGYMCMRLNVTEREVLDPHGGIPIRAAPRGDAPVGTLASSVLLTKQPLHVVAGYAEVMQLTGQPGWIEVGRIKAFDPSTRCVPSIMSNGRPGIG